MRFLAAIQKKKTAIPFGEVRNMRLFCFIYYNAAYSSVFFSSSMQDLQILLSL